MSSQLEAQVGSRSLLFYSARTNFGQIVLDARELKCVFGTLIYYI